MVKRVIVAGLYEEVGSFNPLMTRYEDFQIRRGREILDQLRGTDSATAGGIAVLEARDDIELVPTVHAFRDATGGPVAAADLDRLLGEILASVRDHADADGAFLFLHGAMAGVDEDDPEGRLAARVREILGPGKPITAPMDLHAVLTSRLLDSIDIVNLLLTYPHTDMVSTGERAAHNLLRLLDGEVSPTTARIELPMLVRGDELITATGLFGEAIRHCEMLEETGACLAAGVNIGNPFTDVPELRSNVVVTTDNHPQRARREALRLARFMWRHRADMQADLTPLPEAIRLAEETDGVTVFSDAADSTASGAPGDSNAVLRGLFEHCYSKRALVPVVDAPAVAMAAEAGVGAALTLPLGGTIDSERHTPFEVEARVLSLGDGNFTYEGGIPGEAGLTAVLAAGRHRVMVTERAVMWVGRRVFQAQGLEPLDFDLVVCKSPNGFRVHYESVAARIVAVDLPGGTSANLKSLPFRRLSRPIYPLDEDAAPPPELAGAG